MVQVMPAPSIRCSSAKPGPKAQREAQTRGRVPRAASHSVGLVALRLCALNVLFVARICSGRASDSRKQGRLSGLGKAQVSATFSAIVLGELEVPSGARQPGVAALGGA